MFEKIQQSDSVTEVLVTQVVRPLRGMQVFKAGFWFGLNANMTGQRVLRIPTVEDCCAACTKN